MRRLSSLVLVSIVALASASTGARQPPAAPQGQQGEGRGRGRGGGRGIPIGPGEECPPGTTETRPGTCQAPQLPPPSIVDYRPTTTVVTAEHQVPRAKFPVVDIHSHLAITPENVERTIGEMDALNLRVLVNLSGGGSDRVSQLAAAIRGSKYPERFRVFANVNWDGAGAAGWKEKAVADLEQAIKNGAIGLKVYKNLGLSVKKADGTRLKIDDPDLDPIWQLCAARNIPVLIHVADPERFFAPIDYKNERWLELALFPNRQYPSDRFPSFAELIAERDRMFARNPKTRFINAHFGWQGNDLGHAARLMDRLPNMMMEVGAVLYEFGRQPRAAREFFVKYQDRVLFGKDAYEPSEYPYYWRVFETTDEYFDYYRDYHAFWKLYGMGLPDAVLKKLYYKNALRVAPGLPQTGWPQ